MGWDDVVIGEGNESCSAVRCFSVKGEHSISENKYWYWISSLILGKGMKIKKDTTEGVKLTRMIDDGKPLEMILNYLNKIIIKNLSPSVIYEAIEEAKKESFQEGRDSMAKDFRDLLGIDKFPLY